jgi:RND family efflux transporter MFP subunit
MRGSIIGATAVLGAWAAIGLVAVLPLARSHFGSAEAAQGDAAEAPPRVVMVATARLAPEAAVHRLPGVIAARSQADLGFRVGGKLLTRPVEVGDRIEAGEVVATLDETDLRLELEAAEAELDAARIALEKAEIDLERVTSLESRGWASDKAADDMTVAVEAQRARLLQAERSVELARNRMSYATLHADASGVVTATPVEAGQVVAVGQTVVQVARDGARDAVVAVPEAMLDGLEDVEASVELWSDPGRSLPASLRELSPVADAATRTFEARFALPEGADAALGMSVTVSLAEDSGAPRAEVPLSALLDTGEGPSVWVVGADGRLEARPVVVDGYAAETARISAGLADGDRVVVMGASRLSAGEPVRVLAAEG